MSKGYATQGAQIVARSFRAAAQLADSVKCASCGHKTSKSTGWPTAAGTLCKPCYKHHREIERMIK